MGELYDCFARSTKEYLSTDQWHVAPEDSDLYVYQKTYREPPKYQYPDGLYKVVFYGGIEGCLQYTDGIWHEPFYKKVERSTPNKVLKRMVEEDL